MKLAFFDTKPYDKPGFDARIAGTGLEIKYFETKLSEDTVRLANASGVPVQEWLTQLADAGVRELLVTPDEQAEPDIVRAAQDAGLTLARVGGLAQGGTYFFAAQYDTLAAAGQTGVDTDTEPLPQAQVLDALRENFGAVIR